MTADTLPAAVLPKPPSMRRMIVAAMIGNVLEWFDFVVYGFFAVTIAEVFFPTHDPTVSLLSPGAPLRLPILSGHWGRLSSAAIPTEPDARPDSSCRFR